MSRITIVLLVVLLLVVGVLIYLSTVNTEVAPQRIEQDVTNEALAH